MRRELLAAGARKPPSELLIFPFGETETEKGVFLFDDDAAKLVMDAYGEHGVDLAFDYEHMAVRDGRAGDGLAAGWFQLELRKDGLYAVNIRWTPRATKEIGDAEWRYISPAFDIDESVDPPRVVKLVNIALTNLPATHGLKALVAAGRRKNAMEPEETKKVDAVEDPMAAFEARIARIEKALEKLLPIEEKEHGESFSDDAECTDDGDDSEKDGEREVLADARRLTGKSSPSEIRGVLAAMANSHKKLSAELSEIRKRELSSMVESAVRSGQLLPAQRSWALSMGAKGLRAYLDATPSRMPGFVQQAETPSPQASQMALKAGEELVEVEHLGRKVQVKLSAKDVELANRLGSDIKATALQVLKFRK